jgi:glycosyltransferase involved in cell wall biosynthesis
MDNTTRGPSKADAAESAFGSAGPVVSGLVSVAIPVLNGAEALEQTLAAVRTQRLDPTASLELIVCDSGSHDGSVGVARAYDAEVIEIPPERFSHGETRNLLMHRANGAHVAFLTQDAVPADDGWLARLLGAFTLAPDVALAYGPYKPRDDASPMVARELTEWFRSLAPDGAPRIDRLCSAERTIPPAGLDGARGFFSDANGCVARAAWEAVSFRAISYAEDRALALDMLRAGFAKAYLPDAAVIHSHDYSSWNWFRRSFDEARAIAEIYGVLEPLQWHRTSVKIWGLVGADWRWACTHERRRSPGLLVRSTWHHAVRTLGAILGARATRLPRLLVPRLSLERRG